MIAFVQGPVAAIAAGVAVVEVGGVGMAVQCTPSTLAGLRLGEPARLATSLLVRPDGYVSLTGAAADRAVIAEPLRAYGL